MAAWVDTETSWHGWEQGGAGVNAPQSNQHHSFDPATAESVRVPLRIRRSRGATRPRVCTVALFGGVMRSVDYSWALAIGCLVATTLSLQLQVDTLRAETRTLRAEVAGIRQRQRRPR